ncbi:uncharacterized protein F4807DRAFT_243709 [Annulohypoxylon truncatum]|uniref:uncharacterized protein n=1 Tax=Annulohypoxylon truncatum TaxID=327061 RepID=UPI002008D2E8|nr:uncharacterized protein F4807DRAFT_243709 [Annulohypoxylon truncatum]KAI1206048.1 hypothetical protein F4807DRAFT_243709 [Annulohypoxylon truncatum]
MSLKKVVTPAIAPDTARIRETADRQLGSILFGRLPLEIRDIIYAECWKASGLEQHVFIRDGRLTHWPCTLASDEVDERLEELQRMLEAQEFQPRSRTRSLVLDDKWARRFSSPWHNHWRCEEEMDEAIANEGGHCYSPRSSRTLFLPILLACKRTYLEARPSLYASLTPIFTDLSAAHAFLSLSPSTVSSQLRSLSLSLALPVETLHQHHLQTHPTDPPGPWADLCTALSNLVRFAALREVTLRLAVGACDPSTNSANSTEQTEPETRIKIAGSSWRDTPSWPEVRERWALSAVRGLLARRLTVELPQVAPTYTYPEWAKRYQYLSDSSDSGDGGGRGVPFKKLVRYQALPPMRVRGDGRVEPRMDGPRSPRSPGVSGAGSGAGSGVGGDKGEGETRLRRMKGSVRKLVGGLRTS